MSPGRQLWLHPSTTLRGMAHPYQPYPVVIQPPPTSSAAVAALVFGILGVMGGWCAFGLPCVLAVIFGHVGLAATADNRQAGHGMALAGAILGYIFVIPMIVFTVLFIGFLAS